MTGRETFAQRMGRAGEEYTAGWLLRRGYAILARNWRCPWGELDIIARQGEFVDFVEVKARRPGAAVSPAGAVDRRKQQKLVRAAGAWLDAAGCGLQPRMDVAAMTIREHRGQIFISDFEFYESAFGE